MKEFVVHSLNRFLAIADYINTPFKFYEVSQAEPQRLMVEARVWLRTAFLAYKQSTAKENLEGLQKTFEEHGFAQTTIEETPLTIH